MNYLLDTHYILWTLFEPDKIKVPLPALVSPPVPEIAPEKFVLELLLPVDRVVVPRLTVPSPARDPMV